MKKAKAAAKSSVKKDIAKSGNSTKAANVTVKVTAATLNSEPASSEATNLNLKSEQNLHHLNSTNLSSNSNLNQELNPTSNGLNSKPNLILQQSLQQP